MSSILKKKKSTKIFLIVRVILSMAGATQGVMVSHSGHVGTGAPSVRLSKGRYMLDLGWFLRSSSVLRFHHPRSLETFENGISVPHLLKIENILALKCKIYLENSVFHWGSLITNVFYVGEMFELFFYYSDCDFYTSFFVIAWWKARG